MNLLAQSQMAQDQLLTEVQHYLLKQIQRGCGAHLASYPVGKKHDLPSAVLKKRTSSFSFTLALSFQTC
jgi:hypothetical protein